MEEMIIEKKSKKIEKKLKKKIEEKKPERSKTPPSKSNDYNGWHKWYDEVIREKLFNGQSRDSIAEELNITKRGLEAFIK